MCHRDPLPAGGHCAAHRGSAFGTVPVSALRAQQVRPPPSAPPPLPLSAPSLPHRRDRDAAAFFLHRAARKLLLAGVCERDGLLVELRARIASAEAEPPAAASAAANMGSAAPGGRVAGGGADGGAAGADGRGGAAEETGCVVC